MFYWHVFSYFINKLNTCSHISGILNFLQVQFFPFPLTYLSNWITQVFLQKYLNLVQPVAFVTDLPCYMPINSFSWTKLHLVGAIILFFPSISLSYMMGFSCLVWFFPFLWSEIFQMFVSSSLSFLPPELLWPHFLSEERILGTSGT